MGRWELTVGCSYRALALLFLSWTAWQILGQLRWHWGWKGFVIQDFELFVSRFCWQERPSGLSQLQRSWSTLDLVSWRRAIISFEQYSFWGYQLVIYYTQANLPEVIDVFGALGIEVTEGQASSALRTVPVTLAADISGRTLEKTWGLPRNQLQVRFWIFSVVPGYKLQQMCFALKMAPALLAVDHIWVY